MGGRDLAGAIRESIVDSILSCVPKSWYPPKNQLDELTKIVERYSVKAFKPLERLIPSRPQIPGAKIAAWFP